MSQTDLANDVLNEETNIGTIKLSNISNFIG